MASMTNWGILLENLAMLPAAEPITVPGELSYLMGAIVEPLLNDQTVALSSLDYDRFDEDALDLLIEYIAYLTKTTADLQEIVDSAERLVPLGTFRPIFC